VRGILQVALALLIAASFGGWVVTLGVLVRPGSDMRVIHGAFLVITALYGLLALAIGNTLGRRQGMRGVAAAALGSLLAWGVLELFYSLWKIGSPQMRAPLVLGVALSVAGAAIGVSRAADREAVRLELEQELGELADDEDERPPADQP